MSQPSIDQIVEKLGLRLNGSLPGAKAQMRMAPAHRENLMRDLPAREEVREAAVLAAITGSGAPSLVLTERRADLKNHPGQISFPGGRREPEEDLLQTALRESEEEIGLCSRDVRIIGRLSPLFVPPSRFHVFPFVGVIEGVPVLKPDSDEVTSIILADIGRLCDPLSRSTETRTLGGRKVEIPYFDLDGHKIWGATAMMIAELVELLTG